MLKNRERVPDWIKKTVRQKQGGLCDYCGSCVGPSEEEYHHFGDPQNPNNVQLVHRKCHSQGHVRVFSEKGGFFGQKKIISKVVSKKIQPDPDSILAEGCPIPNIRVITRRRYRCSLNASKKNWNCPRWGYNTAGPECLTANYNKKCQYLRTHYEQVKI